MTAAVINVALSVIAIVLSIPALYLGAQGTTEGDVPFVVNIVNIALATLGLAGSAGVLRRQRWGTVVVILVRAVDGLSSMLGVIAPASASTHFWAVVSVVGAAVVIYLLLRRRPA